MRWIAFIILAYLATVVQTTLSSLLVIHTDWAGDIAPDLMAAMAVFIALRLRQSADVAIACWALGFLLDLVSTGAPVIGPMSLAYAAGGWVITRIRDGFFRDRASSQIVTTGIFCVVSHLLYVTMLGLFLRSFAGYGTMLLEVVMVSLYSALAAPVVHKALGLTERWLIPSAGRAAWGR